MRPGVVTNAVMSLVLEEQDEKPHAVVVPSPSKQVKGLLCENVCLALFTAIMKTSSTVKIYIYINIYFKHHSFVW